MTLTFVEQGARKRIRSILDTLIEKKIRHVVLGAFGCGAFLNPTTTVAKIFKEELQASRASFSVVAFAIFNAGYDKGSNFIPFDEAFRDFNA